MRTIIVPSSVILRVSRPSTAERGSCPVLMDGLRQRSSRPRNPGSMKCDRNRLPMMWTNKCCRCDMNLSMADAILLRGIPLKTGLGSRLALLSIEWLNG
jgi:hypothetical protein